MGHLTRTQLGRLRGETSALLYHALDSAPAGAQTMIEDALCIVDSINLTAQGNPGNPAFNYLNYLPELAANERLGPYRGLIASLSELKTGLPWMQSSTYEHVAAMQNYLAASAYCQLIGPKGAMPSHQVKVGFWGMGPELCYPEHSHAAAETYVILSGNMRWKIGNNPARDVGPGDVMYHAPWEEHAMETLDAPALACFIWTEHLEDLPVANVA